MVGEHIFSDEPDFDRSRRVGELEVPKRAEPAKQGRVSVADAEYFLLPSTHPGSGEGRSSLH